MESIYTLDRGVIHVEGGMEQDGARFHYATQSGMQFKTYQFFISGSFHLIFSDCGWSWVTETVESEAAVKGGTTTVHLHYLFQFLLFALPSLCVPYVNLCSKCRLIFSHMLVIFSCLSSSYIFT